MSFAWPFLFWLLLLPLGFLLWEISHRRRIQATTFSKILRAEVGANSLRWSKGNAEQVVSKQRIRPWLWVGLALAIVAGARPQWGRLEEPVFDQAREILIAIDLSRSMLTPDVKPSRLDRAKLLTQSLLEKLNGERIGLVVFSGSAFLQSPLSSDYEILREFLPALDPDFLPEGGTNYEALLNAATDAFGSTAASDRFLVILSDGEATDENWRSQLPELKKKGIRVIGLGVGTPTGSMIPDGAGGLVKDERGAVVLSKLEPATLRELAEATNGIYQDASSWIDLAGLITSTIEAGQQGEFVEKNTVRLVERFQWPLALGLWCLLVSFYYEFPVRPKSRDLKLPPSGSITSNKERALKAALMTLIILGLGLVPKTPLRAADAKAEPEIPPLAKMVGRLSTTPEPTARDWAELGRETVTWGSRLKSAQQPVNEGPVLDALAAAHLGETMDPKTADWPKLKQELEALLQKPDDQKQNQKNQQKQDEQKQDQQEQENQEQSKEDQQKQKDADKQKQSGDPSKESSDPKSEERGSEGEEEKSSAFGDMKDRPPPPPPGDTQEVGGAPEKEEGEEKPIDPSMALPLQKLQQLRNQDSPAELFKMMEGDKKPAPGKKIKDW